MFQIEGMHEKIDVWNRFVSENPACGEQLRQIAFQMQSNSLEVPSSGMNQDDLQRAVSCGLLSVGENGVVVFTGLEVFLYFLACEICDTR